jgi:hypothetical protein
MTLIDRARRHLAKNNMTYAQHFAFAGGHGLRCLRAAACLVIHAICPCWYRRAGSRLVHRLEQDFTEHRGG